MQLTDYQSEVKARAEKLGYKLARVSKQKNRFLYGVFDPDGKPVWGAVAFDFDECWAKLADSRGEKILATNKEA